MISLTWESDGTLESTVISPEGSGKHGRRRAMSQGLEGKDVVGGPRNSMCKASRTGWPGRRRSPYRGAERGARWDGSLRPGDLQARGAREEVAELIARPEG